MTASNPFAFGQREEREASTLLSLARAEDLGGIGDITSNALIAPDAIALADVVSREPGVLAGIPVLEMLLDEFDLRTDSEILRADGAALTRGTVIARIRGNLRSLLAFERIALNFLQRLSGIATLTAQFVSAVAGTRAAILDTRKTTPGWRLLQKYAVRCGGGCNHRLGLYDAVLIKDNHLDWLAFEGRDSSQSPIVQAIGAARAHAAAGTVIEIEVDDLDQFDQALGAQPDIILVDNLGSDRIREAVRRRDQRAARVLLEASGGINLSTVAEIARTGVDRISVGALTHSSPALDLALDLQMAVRDCANQRRSSGVVQP